MDNKFPVGFQNETTMNKFNLRVYGLLRNERDEILLSSELRFGKSMIKFPGGGLEFNEGLTDCLQREFMEECGVQIEVGELFYVNDFLQASAFHSNEQQISFYYLVNYDKCSELPTVSLDYLHETEGEKLVWHPLATLSAQQMTFPIDKIVATKLNLLTN